jgi:hypothetical protein
MVEQTPRDIEIRELSADDRELFAEIGAEPTVELRFTKHWGPKISHSNCESLTAAELVDLHHKITLYLASVAGAVFVRDAGVTYRVKISTAPERHPEHEACRRTR